RARAYILRGKLRSPGEARELELRPGLFVRQGQLLVRQGLDGERVRLVLVLLVPGSHFEGPSVAADFVSAVELVRLRGLAGHGDGDLALELVALVELDDDP